MLNAETSLKQINGKLFELKNSNFAFVGYKDKDVKKIDKELKKIDKEWLVDYSIRPNITHAEKNKLLNLLNEYMLEKKDEFNSHYLNLLAFYITELKVFPVKSSDKLIIIFESEHGFQIRRFLKLFLRHKKTKRFFLDGLVKNYLDNYNNASKKFKSIFYKYLKRLKYCKNVKYFFKPTEFKIKLALLKQEYFIEKILYLGITPAVLDTKYFIEIRNDVKGK